MYLNAICDKKIFIIFKHIGVNNQLYYRLTFQYKRLVESQNVQIYPGIHQLSTYLPSLKNKQYFISYF